jgi:sulfonate transport system ATP-binding protein
MNWATLYAGQREMELEAEPDLVRSRVVQDVVAPGPGRSVAIRLDNVAKAFGDRAVLNDLSLTIDAGQFVAVVGRSGCGKTTLLRMIAGLEVLTAGRLSIDDQPVSGLRDDVRLLFQEPRLLPWHRVLSNVGIARGSDWQARAQAALEDVGLGDRAKDWPAVLSGGQRQRVALARALVTKPKALLMDEPFGALDALTRSEMHQLLLRVRTEYGFTAILITHDVREAIALADRILVLKDGGIARDIPIDVPLRLRRASPALAHLEQTILTEV